ncbi:hypothetical protein JCM10207_004888 [Rhodosporidiobolus poonsookiae]
MDRLPVNLWRTILRDSSDDLPLLRLDHAGPPFRPRAAFLANVSLVCRRWHEAVRPLLLCDISVTKEKQLRLLAALLEKQPALSALPTSLKIVWTADTGSVRRDGAKKWRLATRRFAATCTQLLRVEIDGPLASFSGEMAAYFDVSWVEPAAATLTHLRLSRLRLSSYPEISHVRLTAVQSLVIEQCASLDAAEPSFDVFRGHFPSAQIIGSTLPPA